jgi:hypothetical protein
MRLRTDINSRAIRVALVEPNDADVRWFSLIVEELNWPVEITRYTTGLSALKEWSGSTRGSFDLIVVTDMLVWSKYWKPLHQDNLWPDDQECHR